MAGLESPGVRAGFWRRLAASLIDGIVVTVPLQILVVVLYMASNGAVQITTGIVTTTCSTTQQMSDVPDGLAPPPPEGSNFANFCRTGFFGLDTARSVEVGRVTKEGNTTKSIWRGYTLGADGKPNAAISLDWVTLLALFIYLVGMEHRCGATLGKRVLHIRTIDADAPTGIGIPLRKAVVRNLLMWVGFVPLFAVLLVYDPAASGDLEALLTGGFFTWFAIAACISFAWDLWILVNVVGKIDPIYDKLAGTAVVRTATATLT